LVEQWEKRTEIPILLMAAALMVTYTWPVLGTGVTASWLVTKSSAQTEDKPEDSRLS